MRLAVSKPPKPLVSVKDAQLHYRVGSAFSAMRGHSSVVKAVDGVTFEIQKGESVGLLGESGCGKTSMGRLLLKLEEATGGEIQFAGDALSGLKGPALKRYRAALRAASGGALNEEARFGIAEAYRKLGNTESETRALQQFLSRHPEAGLAPKAKARLAELSGVP